MNVHVVCIETIFYFINFSDDDLNFLGGGGGWDLNDLIQIFLLSGFP